MARTAVVNGNAPLRSNQLRQVAMSQLALATSKSRYAAVARGVPWLARVPRLTQLVVVETVADFALVILAEALQDPQRRQRGWPIAALGEITPGLRRMAASAGTRLLSFSSWQSAEAERARAMLQLGENGDPDPGRALALRTYRSALEPASLSDHKPGTAGDRRQPERDGLVMGVGQGDALTVAAGHALMLGLPLRLVSSAPEVVEIVRQPGRGPLTIIGDSDLFDDPELCAAVADQPGVLGCLTLSPWWALTQWLARTYLGRREPHRPDILFSEFRRRSEDQGRLRIVGREDSAIAAVQRSLTAGHRLLLLDSHGTDERLYIGRSSISSLSAGDSESGPDRTTIEPRAVAADHLFIDTCFGLQLDPGPVPRPSRVATEILSRWATTFASTMGTKDNSSQECLLYYSLVCSGMPVGEAVAWVNRWLVESGLDAPSYVLAGEPRLVLDSARSTAWSLKQTGDMTWRLEFHDVRALAAVALLQERQLCRFASAGRLWVAGGAEFEHTFLINLADGRLAIVASRWRADPLRRAALQLTAQPPVSPWLQDLCLTLPDRSRALGWQKALPVKALGLIQSLEADISRAQRLLASEAAAARQSPAVQRLEDELRRQLIQLQEVVVENVLARSAAAAMPTDSYRENYLVAATRPARCGCGASAFAKALRAPFEMAPSREVVVCRACGIVGDWPSPRPLHLDLVVRPQDGSSAFEIGVQCGPPIAAATLTTLGARLTSTALPRGALNAASTVVTTGVRQGEPITIPLTLPYPAAARGVRCRIRLVAVMDLRLGLIQLPAIPA